MRLPRWLLVVLVSASPLSVLVFSAWMWHGWPERTMRKFSSSLVAENLNVVNAMIPSGKRFARVWNDRPIWLLADYENPSVYDGFGYYLSREDRQAGFRYEQMERMPRTVSDWIAGRARFRVHTLEFAAQRGEVTVRNGENPIIIPYRPDLKNLVEWPTDEDRGS